MIYLVVFLCYVLIYIFIFKQLPILYVNIVYIYLHILILNFGFMYDINICMIKISSTLEEKINIPSIYFTFSSGTYLYIIRQRIRSSNPQIKNPTPRYFFNLHESLYIYSFFHKIEICTWIKINQKIKIPRFSINQFFPIHNCFSIDFFFFNNQIKSRLFVGRRIKQLNMISQKEFRNLLDKGEYINNGGLQYRAYTMIIQIHEYATFMAILFDT